MDYIITILNYVPEIVIGGVIIMSVKFLSPILLLRAKRNVTKQQQFNKPKSLMDSAEAFFGNAPQLYMAIENQVQELRAKGATEEQLKGLLEKQKWLGRFADPMYGQVLQTVVLGGIRYVKKLGISI